MCHDSQALCSHLSGDFLSRALSGKRLKVYYDFLVEYMERLKQSTHYCIFTTRLGWLAHQNKNSKIQIIVYSKSNRP